MGYKTARLSSNLVEPVWPGAVEPKVWPVWLVVPLVLTSAATDVELPPPLQAVKANAAKIANKYFFMASPLS